MRVILVPLTGDDHDRVALAAAYTVASPRSNYAWRAFDVARAFSAATTCRF